MLGVVTLALRRRTCCKLPEFENISPCSRISFIGPLMKGYILSTTYRHQTFTVSLQYGRNAVMLHQIWDVVYVQIHGIVVYSRRDSAITILTDRTT